MERRSSRLKRSKKGMQRGLFLLSRKGKKTASGAILPPCLGAILPPCLGANTPLFGCKYPPVWVQIVRKFRFLNIIRILLSCGVRVLYTPAPAAA